MNPGGARTNPDPEHRLAAGKASIRCFDKEIRGLHWTLTSPEQPDCGSDIAPSAAFRVSGQAMKGPVQPPQAADFQPKAGTCINLTKMTAGR